MAKTITDSYKFMLGNTRLYPAGSFSLNWERYEDEVFYRKNISTLQFINDVANSVDDFNTFWNIENSTSRCNGVPLVVSRKCNGSFVEIFKGNVHMVDGEWNISDCIVNIDVRPKDKYSKVLDNWEKQVNVFDFVPPEDRIQLDTLHGKIEFKTCEYEKEVAGGSSYDLNFALDECLEVKHIWWEFEHEAEIVDKKESWWKNIFGFGKDEFISVERKRTVWVHEVADTIGEYPEEWTEYDGKYYRKPRMFVTEKRNVDQLDFKIVRKRELISKLFDNGITIKDFFEVLAEQTCGLGTKVESKFFSINAVNDGINDAYQYAKDYFSKIVVYDKSDIKYNNKDQNAPIFAINSSSHVHLRSMLDDLKKWANVYWDVQKNGDGTITLIVEHISHFQKFGDWDFTIGAMRKFIEGKIKYSYKTNQLPKAEYFQYMDDVSEDFTGLPITYDNGCVANEKNGDRKYKCSYTTNDVFWMVANSDEVSDYGAVFVCADDKMKKIREDFVFIKNKVHLNGAMSFYNLIPKLHTWNRPQPAGVVNGSPFTFYTSKPMRNHDPFTIYTCCNSVLNMTMQKKRTFLGWCDVNSVTLDEPSGGITFNLEF